MSTQDPIRARLDEIAASQFTDHRTFVLRDALRAVLDQIDTRLTGMDRSEFRRVIAEDLGVTE